MMFRALLAVAQLASQTALVGTVTDSSGSVVPGAVVVAVNIGTQDTHETTTNAQGRYNFQFVRTGKYEVTVSLTGFRTFKVSGIEVANNQVVRRVSHGLQAMAHYTWSRTRDQTDHSNNNNGRATQDPYNPMADYGRVLGCAASLRRELRVRDAVLHQVRATSSQACRRWLAGERHHDD